MNDPLNPFLNDYRLYDSIVLQVLMMPEHCETVCSSLKQILSVPVDVSRRELTELKVRTQSVKELSTVEVTPPPPPPFGNV